MNIKNKRLKVIYKALNSDFFEFYRQMSTIQKNKYGKMIMVNRLLNYAGSKSNIAKDIVPHIMKIPHNLYVEPYGGSCGLLFNKPVSQMNIINDIDYSLINFMNVVKNMKHEFVERFKEIALISDVQNSINNAYMLNYLKTDGFRKSYSEMLSKQKTMPFEEYNEFVKSFVNLDLAVLYYISNFVSYRSIIDFSGNHCKFGVKIENMIQNFETNYKNIENIIKKTIFYCNDGVYFLEKLVLSQAKPYHKILAYIDTPYSFNTEKLSTIKNDVYRVFMSADEKKNKKYKPNNVQVLQENDIRCEYNFSGYDVYEDFILRVKKMLQKRYFVFFSSMIYYDGLEKFLSDNNLYMIDVCDMRYKISNSKNNREILITNVDLQKIDLLLS